MQKAERAPSLLLLLILVFLLTAAIDADAGRGRGDYPPPSVPVIVLPTTAPSGTYTFNWSSNGGANTHYTIQESVNGGPYSSVVSQRGNGSETVTRPYGTYSYRGQACSSVGGCSAWSSPRTIEAGLPAVPESTIDQLGYVYEIRTGDFDGNGYKDILVDRMTPGDADGSLQTTVIEGTSSGPTAAIPSPSDLASARTHPVNSAIKVGGTDRNFDGYVDLILKGLDSLSEPIYSAEDLVLYASGVPGNAAPAGVQLITDEYKELFSNVMDQMIDPNFYADNTTVSQRVIRHYELVCPFQWYTDFTWNLWACFYDYTGSSTVTQVTGIGYHPSAPAVSDALDAVVDNDFSQGNALKQLSDLLKPVIGVDSFGYQPDGSLAPTNFVSQGPQGDAVVHIGRTLGEWFLNVTLDFSNINFGNNDPGLWVRHLYGDEVESEICDVNSDTRISTSGNLDYPTGIFGGHIVIPKEVCTIENVYCWQRRMPAPRADSRDTSLVDAPFEESDLSGFIEFPNPITTFVYPDSFVTVNETQDGHRLHDEFQEPGCAAHREWQSINGFGPIPNRCSYVWRKTQSIGEKIHIITHGEGYNPTPRAAKANEKGGTWIFNDVNDWIRVQLAREGMCPLSD